ncbi:unnamed protein product [Parajaminaea phylloscopi]
MDYYSQYGPLLPPPGRGPFSPSRSDGRRGILPDYTNLNDPAEGLRRFIDGLAYPRLPVSSYAQFKAGAISVACLIALCGLILGRRLYERSFWLFRIAKRSTSVATRRTESVIIPNALLAFTLMAGCFGAVLVALDFQIISLFKAKTTLPWSIPAWICLPWLAVMHGAVWAAWGTFYARPSAGLSIASPVNSPLCRFFRKSLVINAMCIGTPFAFDIIILVPTLIANAKYNRFLTSYAAWQSKWQSSTSLSHDMLVEAQELWYGMIACAQRISVVFVLWSVIALAIWLSYTWVGYQLLKTIRQQILTLESRTAPQLTTDINHDRGPKAHEQQHSKTVSQQLDEKASPNTRSDGEADGSCSPSQERGDVEGGLFTRAQLSQDEPAAAFFPAVRPSKIVRKKVMSRQATRKSQARYLRRIWWNVFIQTISISAAVLAFLGVSIFAAAEVYVAYEINETGYVYSRALLWACWTSVFFGFVVLAAIAGRVYEPVAFGAERHGGRALNSRQRKHLSKLSSRMGGSHRTHTPPPLDRIQIQTSFFESESVGPGVARTRVTTGSTQPTLPTIPSSAPTSPASPALARLPPSDRSVTRPRMGSTSSRATSVEAYAHVREDGKSDAKQDGRDTGETVYVAALPRLEDESGQEQMTDQAAAGRRSQRTRPRDGSRRHELLEPPQGRQNRPPTRRSPSGSAS